MNNKLLFWSGPRKFPYLSPIENVWSWLKVKVSERTPKNEMELGEVIKEERLRFSPEEASKYVNSMPSRLAQLSHRNGAHPGY